MVKDTIQLDNEEFTMTLTRKNYGLQWTTLMHYFVDLLHGAGYSFSTRDQEILEELCGGFSSNDLSVKELGSDW